MPVLPAEIAKPFFLAKNAHLQTIIPNITRIVKLKYTRERVELPDGDFIDLDWTKKGSDKLVIALHGLEGQSARHYVKGSLKEMNRLGWDGVAMNFRGCSGSPNRMAKSYHSGEIEDLDYIIKHISNTKSYKTITLVGFSLGGNVVLMYGGKMGGDLPEVVKGIAAISAPCDLSGSVLEIEKWYNRHYVLKFMISLWKKTREKRALLSEFNVPHILKSRNFIEFDERYTAPAHGFQSAKDYWSKASSLPFLPEIKVPTLIMNSRDDTFLSQASSPFNLAKNSSYLHLMQPDWGGHVGFFDKLPWSTLWSERQIGKFFAHTIGL